MRICIFIALGVGALILLLNALVPDQLASDYARQRVVYLAILLAVTAAAILQYRDRIGTTALQLAIWAGLFLLLVLGYSFRDEVFAKRPKTLKGFRSMPLG